MINLFRKYKKRYFIISFKCESVLVSRGFGLTAITVTGGFPKKEYLRETIKAVKKDITDIVILNIMELSKRDYLDFTAELNPKEKMEISRKYWKNEK